MRLTVSERNAPPANFIIIKFIVIEKNTDIFQLNIKKLGLIIKMMKKFI